MTGRHDAEAEDNSYSRVSYRETVSRLPVGCTEAGVVAGRAPGRRPTPPGSGRSAPSRRRIGSISRPGHTAPPPSNPVWRPLPAVRSCRPVVHWSFRPRNLASAEAQTCSPGRRLAPFPASRRRVPYPPRSPACILAGSLRFARRTLRLGRRQPSGPRGARAGRSGWG
jgi:hypothetical protein